MKLDEILNDDTLLFVHCVEKILREPEPVWLRWKSWGDAARAAIGHTNLCRIYDYEPATSASTDISFQVDDGNHYKWIYLSPFKEYTISKENIGWVIHEVD